MLKGQSTSTAAARRTKAGAATLESMSLADGRVPTAGPLAAAAAVSCTCRRLRSAVGRTPPPGLRRKHGSTGEQPGENTSWSAARNCSGNSGRVGVEGTVAGTGECWEHKELRNCAQGLMLAPTRGFSRERERGEAVRREHEWEHRKEMQRDQQVLGAQGTAVPA